MSKLTRDKIGKLLGEHNIGNFSSLISKKNKDLTKNEPSAIIKPKFKEDPKKLERFPSNSGHSSNKKTFKPLTIEENLNQKTVSIPLATLNTVSKPLAPEGQTANENKAYLPVQRQTPLEWTNLIAGKEFDLIMHLIGLCEKECSLRTPAVFSKDLIELLFIKATHLRNLILRLTEKGLGKIILHKSGRHALRIFEFEKDVYSSLVARKNKLNQKMPVFSQSFVDKENSNSNVNEPNYLQEEFFKIDLSPMETYGFNSSHIIQLYREYKTNPGLKLSDEIVQDSINAMAFDLKHNNVDKDFKNPPAVVLLSLLKKGKPYSSKTPEKFVSPQVEAMRRYVETKSKEQKERQDLENRTKQLALQEWLNGLSELELISFYQDNGQLNTVPEKTRVVLIRRQALQGASDYFESSIWPTKRKELVGSIE